MMKKLLVPFLLAIVTAPVALNAQVWCPHGAVWHYAANPCMGACPGFVKMVSAGDTMVNGQPCTRLERTGSYFNLIYQYEVYDTLPELYTYEDQGVVWMFDPGSNAFDTLYNFNASPGDQWQLLAMPGPPTCSTSSYYTVLDTGTMVVSGFSLRWLSVDVTFVLELDNDTMIFADTLVESIGSLHSYMLPHDACNGMLDWSEGGNLRCYSDDSITYMHDTSQDCEFTVGIGEHAIQQDLKIYPNPGSELLHVGSAKSGKVEVRVLDSTGRQVLSSKGFTGSMELNTSGLLSGVYLIEICTNQGRQTIKWAKQ